MFISKLIVHNFRSFTDEEIDFHEGINVIIGHNNAGKTNLLKALGLIFDNNSKKRLEIDDFNKSIDIDKYFQIDNVSNELIELFPPSIKISVILSESSDPKNEFSDDKNILFNWMISLTPTYKAKLTFEFFLPDGKDAQKYSAIVKKFVYENKISKSNFWNEIFPIFISKYISRIYVGDEKFKNRVELDSLNRFDFQFLDAIRDVESELFSGKNTLLKEVLNHFLDNEQTDNQELKKEFSDSSSELIESIKKRIDTKPILEYSHDVGASLGGTPDFHGKINEIDLFSALKLVIRKDNDILLPITHNGLGYNNLIYISILLSKMQKSLENPSNDDEYKIYPMLIIEEPEAHLHPAMQYKFLKFLKKNIGEKVRQVFVTTHSTHITSSVELDEIICLNKIDSDKLNISYPGKVFNPNSEEDQKSKKLLKRYLDVTKSDMLFSKSIILVEGLVEQLLIPIFAKGQGKEFEDKHISVISINGTFFSHFLKLFDYNAHDPFKKYALRKNICCLIDPDPSKKTLESEDKKSSFKSCYPFEIGHSIAKFEYKKHSDIIDKLEKHFISPNIRIFSSKNERGKTLEYDLMFQNADNKEYSKLLISNFISKKDELLDLIENFDSNIDSFYEKVSIDKDIIEIIKDINWNEKDKKRSLISARYLKSIESTKSKGENAFEILSNLKENMNQNSFSINIPKHIEDMINFIF